MRIHVYTYTHILGRVSITSVAIAKGQARQVTVTMFSCQNWPPCLRARHKSLGFRPNWTQEISYVESTGSFPKPQVDTVVS